MESIAFYLYDNRKYRPINNLDDDFGYLCLYLSEGTLWGFLIDPDGSCDLYSCGDFFCTKRDAFNLYISDFITLDKHAAADDDEKPVIINVNAILGLLVGIDTLSRLKPKPQDFFLSKQGQRYIFTSSELEQSIIVDPDLGNLYNEIVPYMIIRKNNNLFSYVLHSNNEKGDPSWRYKHSDEMSVLLYNLIIPIYPEKLIETMRNWPNKPGSIDTTLQHFIHNDIKISNLIDAVTVASLDPKNGVGMILTKTSLITFLQAWESRLQYCDAFTLVFLGQTLRFFEGEPLSSDQNFRIP